MLSISDICKNLLSVTFLGKTRSGSINASMHHLVMDGDDARDLISVVCNQLFVDATMLGVGLLWAFIKGWQLTFAGLAIAPGFATTMVVQTKLLVARCVVRNKQAREDVARDYYNVCFVLIFCSSRDAHLAILPPDCH